MSKNLFFLSVLILFLLSFLIISNLYADQPRPPIYFFKKQDEPIIDYELVKKALSKSAWNTVGVLLCSPTAFSLDALCSLTSLPKEKNSLGDPLSNKVKTVLLAFFSRIFLMYFFEAGDRLFTVQDDRDEELLPFKEAFYKRFLNLGLLADVFLGNRSPRPFLS